MTLELKIDLEEFKPEEQFKEIQKRYEDLEPIAPELARICRQDLERRFLSSPSTELGGLVYGGAYWNRLSDSYLAANPRRLGKQIMIDTGRLRRDAISEGSGNFYELRNGEFTFAINTPYANRQHQMRSLLFMHEELNRAIGDRLMRYILTGEKDDLG